MFFIRYLIVLSICLFLCSCNSFKACFAKEFMQGVLADGVARISVMPMSMIVKELEPDREYGFYGPHSRTIIEDLNPKVYGKAKVTSIIENIDIDHDNKEVYKDCQSEKAYWHGKVKIIKATMEMSGYLTGDPKAPVVPDPNTVKITIHAKADRFQIIFASRKESLLIRNGTLKYEVIPRLAQSLKYQMMRVAKTYNTRFQNINLKMNTTLITPDITMNIPVFSSDYYVQTGEGENGEVNKIVGKIKIFEHEREVPYDKKGLDENYNASVFQKTYDCDEELQGKVSYGHVPFAQAVAAPVTAGMSAVLLGAVAKKLEENSDCGFINPENLTNTNFNKNTAGARGHVEIKTEECEISFNDHETEPDAFGESYILNGVFKVQKGRQILNGLITYDQDDFKASVASYAKLLTENKEAALKKAKILKPVAPISSDDFATIHIKSNNFNVSVKPKCLQDKGQVSNPHHCKNNTNWKKTKQGLEFKLISKTSNLTGVIKPKLAKDTDKKSQTFGICKEQTKVANMTIDYDNVYAEFVAPKEKEEDAHKKFNFLSNGKLEFFSGQYDNTRENKLIGTNFSIGDKQLNINTALDPNYERQKYKDSYMLGKKITEVYDNEECNPEKAFGVNIARLLVLNAGALLSYANTQMRSPSNIMGILKKKLIDSEKNLVTLTFAQPIGKEVKLKANHDEDGKTIILENSIFNSFNFTSAIVGEFKKEEYKKLKQSIEKIKIEAVSNNKEFVPDNKGANKASKWLKEKWKGLKEGAAKGRELIGNRIESIKDALNNITEIVSAAVKNENSVFVRPTRPDSYTLTLETKINNFSAKSVSGAETPIIKFEEAGFKINATPFMALNDNNKDNASYDIKTSDIKFSNITVENAKAYFTYNGMKIPLAIHKAELMAKNGNYRGSNNISGYILFNIVNNLAENYNADNGVKVEFKYEALLPPLRDE